MVDEGEPPASGTPTAKKKRTKKKARGDRSKPSPPSYFGPLPPRKLDLRTILWVTASLFAIALFGVWAGARFTAPQADFPIAKLHVADFARVLIILFASLFGVASMLSAALRRPIPRWFQKTVAGVLAAGAIVTYFNGFNLAYPDFYHRHEHYHQYLGAKYFPELAYDGLYECTIVAEDELGHLEYVEGVKPGGAIDLYRETRDRRRAIRDLSDGSLIPASKVLEHPEHCKDRFSSDRWTAFRADIAFFRSHTERDYWFGMQRDHGFHMSPVWLLAGRLFASFGTTSVGFLQFLAAIDLFLLAGMFAAIFWAFGWRVASAAIVFWGCQRMAPDFWTLGAFLRQDWLFLLVLSVCLVRKRRFLSGGASLAYASLIQPFCALFAIGWGAQIVVGLVRARRFPVGPSRAAAGMALGAVLLFGAATLLGGVDAHSRYRTRQAAYASVPLTNEMGLSSVVSHEFDGGPGSGRMKYAQDPTLPDPFSVWKRMRIERYAKWATAARGVMALSVVLLVFALRRSKSTWIAVASCSLLAATFATLLNYVSVYLLVSVPLTRAKRGLEVAFYLFAAASQVVGIEVLFNDDRFAAMSLLVLLFTVSLLVALTPLRGRQSRQGPRGLSRGEVRGVAEPAGPA